jgi:hypothetical protein
VKAGPSTGELARRAAAAARMPRDAEKGKRWTSRGLPIHGYFAFSLLFGVSMLK